MDADGTNVDLLTPLEFGENAYRASPDWSPDGRLVAFQSQIAGTFQILTINLRDRSLRSSSRATDGTRIRPGRRMADTSPSSRTAPERSSSGCSTSRPVARASSRAALLFVFPPGRRASPPNDPPESPPDPPPIPPETRMIRRTAVLSLAILSVAGLGACRRKVVAAPDASRDEPTRSERRLARRAARAAARRLHRRRRARGA